MSEMFSECLTSDRHPDSARDAFLDQAAEHIQHCASLRQNLNRYKPDPASLDSILDQISTL